MAIVLAAGGLCGCLEREMTITSEPPGALVTLNQVEIGRTPVTTPFKWYGDYDVRLELDGHKSIHTHAGINPPIQEVPPFDLFSELAPWTFRDRRYLNYKMEELVLPDEDQLIRRAEELRAKNLQPPK